MYQNNLLKMAIIKKICNDGFERTVGKGNIKRDSFMGTSIFGDTYRLGRLPVKKVIYEQKNFAS